MDSPSSWLFHHYCQPPSCLHLLCSYGLILLILLLPLAWNACANLATLVKRPRSSAAKTNAVATAARDTGSRVYSPHRRTGRPRKRTEISLDVGNGEQPSEPKDFAMVDAPQEPAQSMGLGLPDPMHGGGSIFHPSIEDALLGASFPDAGGAPGIDFSAQDLNDANFQTRIPSASLSSPELFNDFSLFMSDYDLPSISALSGQSQPPLGLDRVPSLNVNASTPASESSGDCRAKCYTLLLQQLLFPRQSLPESTRPSIDVILQAGRRLRQVLDRILGCSVCVSNRSSILLLAVVMERVVQMLDWIIEEKTVLHAENARSRRRALNSWMQNPSSPDVQDGKKNVCRIPLLVGDTAVDEDTKQSFLKQLILTRMKMLAAKLQDVRVKTTTRPGDCIYRAAELMLAESLQRLDYLRGQVQIWEESC